MPIFGSKDKSGNRSVNFMAVDGLPGYHQGDAVNATIDTVSRELVIKARAFKRPEIKLPLARITYAQSKTETEIQERDKSVIERAAVGALLLGPLGAMVGGMSGIGSKKKSSSKNFLIIAYSAQDGNEKAIALEIVGASIGWRDFLKEINPSTIEVKGEIRL